MITTDRYLTPSTSHLLDMLINTVWTQLGSLMVFGERRRCYGVYCRQVWTVYEYVLYEFYQNKLVLTPCYRFAK